MTDNKLIEEEDWAYPHMFWDQANVEEALVEQVDFDAPPPPPPSLAVAQSPPPPSPSSFLDLPPTPSPSAIDSCYDEAANMYSTASPPPSPPGASESLPTAACSSSPHAGSSSVAAAAATIARAKGWNASAAAAAAAAAASGVRRVAVPSSSRFPLPPSPSVLLAVVAGTRILLHHREPAWLNHHLPAVWTLLSNEHVTRHYGPGSPLQDAERDTHALVQQWHALRHDLKSVRCVVTDQQGTFLGIAGFVLRIPGRDSSVAVGVSLERTEIHPFVVLLPEYWRLYVASEAVLCLLDGFRQMFAFYAKDNAPLRRALVRVTFHPEQKASHRLCESWGLTQLRERITTNFYGAQQQRTLYGSDKTLSELLPHVPVADVLAGWWSESDAGAVAQQILHIKRQSAKRPLPPSGQLVASSRLRTFASDVLSLCRYAAHRGVPASPQQCGQPTRKTVLATKKRTLEVQFSQPAVTEGRMHCVLFVRSEDRDSSDDDDNDSTRIPVAQNTLCGSTKYGERRARQTPPRFVTFYAVPAGARSVQVSLQVDGDVCDKHAAAPLHLCALHVGDDTQPVAHWHYRGWVVGGR